MIVRWAVPLLAAAAVLAAPGASGSALTAPLGTAEVTAHFQPAAASFVSPAWGTVLGGVGCGSLKSCRARLAATADSGTTWRFLTAPDVLLFNPAGSSQPSRVSSVLFATPRDGWLYGPALWATHDGGAHWRRISLPGNIARSHGGGVVAMAASGGTVWAVISPDPDAAKAYELYRSPAGSDAWTQVGITGSFASLAVSGTAAWFGTSAYLWATADGTHWHRYPFSCPRYYMLSGISAASSSQVAFLCAFGQGMYQTYKEVLASVNGGRTQHVAGQPAPTVGDPAGFAVPPGRPRLFTISVITPGPDYVYRSADGGKTWTQFEVPGTGGGVSLSSLSYVSPLVGWMVIGQPGGPANRLLRTTDSGRTWHNVPF